MFLRTIETKPLRRYTSFAPENRGGDLLAVVLQLEDAASIKAYFLAFRATPEMDRIKDAIFLDLQDMRDGGVLSEPMSCPGRKVAFLEAWADFLSGDDGPGVKNIITGPVISMIESEAVRLFNQGKFRTSAPNGHDEAEIDMLAAARRMAAVEADLAEALATGTSGRRHAGAITDHDGTGLIRVRLENFRPILEHARRPAEGQRARTWKKLDLAERLDEPALEDDEAGIVPDLEPDPTP